MGVPAGRRAVLRWIGRALSAAALAIRPGARNRSPAERSVLDDIAMRRPWNLWVKLARRRARLGIGRLEPGVTVIIVNWNTADVTADVVDAVQRFSPPDTRVLLVDNGSTDGSRERFRRWPGIATRLLRSNAGHAVALDIGVCAARTTIAVTLDSDAIPLTEGWMEPAVAPVRDGTAVLAGLRSSRDFVHPVYLAVNTAEFIRRGMSFQVHRVSRGDEPERWGENVWDTGELMTRAVRSTEVAFVEPSQDRVPGLPGMTAGGVVYHHGGVSRDAAGSVSAASLEDWQAAVRALGLQRDERSDISRKLKASRPGQ